MAIDKSELKRIIAVMKSGKIPTTRAAPTLAARQPPSNAAPLRPWSIRCSRKPASTVEV